MIVLLRGGGDVASGVALRLHRAGLHITIAELESPLTVRRLVSFSRAISDGTCRVEEVEGARAASVEDARSMMDAGIVAVLVDPEASCRHMLHPAALVDARMRKASPDLGMDAAPLVIGLGPGFTAGADCHAVVETNRGPFLGRVYWQGSAEPDTGQPDSVAGYGMERVLRAPDDGVLESVACIGQLMKAGDVIASVNGQAIRAPFNGVLRGLIQTGLRVTRGLKVGDLDPRPDPRLCTLVSDKALAVAGGVLEALLARPEIRAGLGGGA
jgi:xanthine dehydrogenase accessory factor